MLNCPCVCLKMVAGNSLVVQWLGLSAFTATAPVQSLLERLRFRKPRGRAKTNRKREPQGASCGWTSPGALRSQASSPFASRSLSIFKCFSGCSSSVCFWSAGFQRAVLCVCLFPEFSVQFALRPWVSDQRRKGHWFSCWTFLLVVRLICFFTLALYMGALRLEVQWNAIKSYLNTKHQ